MRIHKHRWYTRYQSFLSRISDTFGIKHPYPVSVMHAVSIILIPYLWYTLYHSFPSRISDTFDINHSYIAAALRRSGDGRRNYSSDSSQLLAYTCNVSHQTIGRAIDDRQCSAMCIVFTMQCSTSRCYYYYLVPNTLITLSVFRVHNCYKRQYGY